VITRFYDRFARKFNRKGAEGAKVICCLINLIGTGFMAARCRFSAANKNNNMGFDKGFQSVYAVF